MILQQTTPQSKPLATVVYSRTEKCYIARNGHELGRFPSGPEGRTAAKWCAIDHDAPDIAAAARQLVAAGSDEGRTIRAARLVIEGKISLDKHEHGYTRATATASDGNLSPVTGLPSYSITHNIVSRCDCADHFYNREDGNRHHQCKHILATKILVTQRREFDAAASRKHADKRERRAAASEAPAQKPWYLRPDPINTSAAGAGRAQFVAHHYGR